MCTCLQKPLTPKDFQFVLDIAETNSSGVSQDVKNYKVQAITSEWTGGDLLNAMAKATALQNVIQKTCPVSPAVSSQAGPAITVPIGPHSYSSEAAGVYTYTANQTDEQKTSGAPATTFAFKYAGVVNGKDVVLGGSGFSTMVACDRPCTSYNISALATPTTVTGSQSFHSPSEEPSKVTIPDLVFDDVQHDRLSIDFGARQTVLKAVSP